MDEVVYLIILGAIIVVGLTVIITRKIKIKGKKSAGNFNPAPIFTAEQIKWMKEWQEDGETAQAMSAQPAPAQTAPPQPAYVSPTSAPVPIPAPAPQNKFCNKCGAELLPGKKFCNKCGNAIQ
jgi:hypothetical protein